MKTTKTMVDSQGVKTKTDSSQSTETKAQSALTKKTSVGIKKSKAESTSETSSEMEPDSAPETLPVTKTKPDQSSSQPFDTQSKPDSTQETKGRSISKMIVSASSFNKSPNHPMNCTLFKLSFSCKDFFLESNL